MKKHGLLGLFLALCAGLMLVTPSVGVDAKPKKKKEKPSKDEPAPIPKAPKLKPKGLKWGLSPSKVADVYDKAIERDYLPRYKKVEPGIQEERLKEEIRQKKRAFRRSWIKLDHPPSSLDGSPFVPEFGYHNKEGFMKIKRKGRWRYLFFWKKKLYKVIDIYKLGDDEKWGDSFDKAVAKVEKIIDKEGRRLSADEDEGRDKDEVDWADKKTHFRVVDWDKKKVAFAWVHQRIEAPIAKARAEAKKKDEEELDPDVKKVLRDKKKKDEDKKKKKK
jgi:hypothetical protein